MHSSSRNAGQGTADIVVFREVPLLDKRKNLNDPSADGIGLAGRWKHFVHTGKHPNRQIELMQIVFTDRFPRPFSRPLDRGKHQADHDDDDRQYNDQFQQSETG
jgi:hypothetical protein